MPREGRKEKRRQGCLSKSSDITLKDFADCSMPQACTRVRKSLIGATSTTTMQKMSGVQVLVQKTESEELDWFEKDFDSFNIPDQTSDDEDSTLSEIALERKTKKERERLLKLKHEGGVVYPPDLWFHLSNFIEPVDIGRFAAICLGTFHITQTAGFWRQLYHRCYKDKREMKEILPAHLKPGGMEKLNGLRARVIAALFHFHGPLVDQILSNGPMEAEPHDLKGYRCLLAWHQPGPRGWQFCFKLQKPSFFLRRRHILDLQNGYTDIFDNPEEGCCVLQVICVHFASVPPVMGLLLKQVFMTLTTNLRHHRLRLHFDSCMSSVNGHHMSSVSDIVANLDDVIGVKVIHWWHPAYPFSPGHPASFGLCENSD